MTQKALDQLWEAAGELAAAERWYWKLAEELTNEGLVTVEDCATIYGIHPQTARKRLAALHYGESHGKQPD